jgi:hypothetical protein
MLLSARVGDVLAKHGHTVMLYVPDYKWAVGCSAHRRRPHRLGIDPSAFVQPPSQYMFVPAGDEREWAELASGDGDAFHVDRSLTTGDGLKFNTLFAHGLYAGCKGRP